MTDGLRAALYSLPRFAPPFDASYDDRLGEPPEEQPPNGRSPRVPAPVAAPVAVARRPPVILGPPPEDE